MVPTASFSPQPATSDFDKYWDKIGRPYEIKFALVYGGNFVRSVQSREIMGDFFGKIPFIVSINTVSDISM